MRASQFEAQPQEPKDWWEPATEMESPTQNQQSQQPFEVYNREQGPDQTYQAQGNTDGTFTVSIGDLSQTYTAEQFDERYAGIDPSPEEDSLQDIEDLFAEEDEDDELDKLKSEINTVKSTLANTPSGQGTQQMNPSLIGSAGAILKGMGRLAGDTMNAAGTALNNTADQVVSWQAKNQMKVMQKHVDSINIDLNTITADPEFKAAMRNVESGAKSAEDVRESLNNRFQSDSESLQDTPLNRAYHRMTASMEAMSAMDLKKSHKKIDLRDDEQHELFKNLKRDVEKLSDRKELEILPDKDGESLKEAAKEMVKQIKELFSKLLSKITNQQTAQLSSAPTPSP